MFPWAVATLIWLQSKLSLMLFELRAVCFVLMSTSLSPASWTLHGSDLVNEMQALCAVAEAPSPTSREPVQVQTGFYYLQLENANMWNSKQWVKVTTIFQLQM